MLDYDTQKDEMDTGNEDRVTARDTKKQQNGIQASTIDTKQVEQCEDRERDGKTTSINSSSLRKQKKSRETISRSKRQNKVVRNGKRIHTVQAGKVLRFLRHEGITSE